MTAREKSIGSNLAKARARQISQGEYDEAPELTDEQLSNAVVSAGVRRGRPPIPNPKQAVKLRLDAEVLAGFRETGPGWQTLINDTLRSALEKNVRKGSGARNARRSTRKAASKSATGRKPA